MMAAPYSVVLHKTGSTKNGVRTCSNSHYGLRLLPPYAAGAIKPICELVVLVPANYSKQFFLVDHSRAARHNNGHS